MSDRRDPLRVTRLLWVGEREGEDDHCGADGRRGNERKPAPTAPDPDPERPDSNPEADQDPGNCRERESKEGQRVDRHELRVQRLKLGRHRSDERNERRQPADPRRDGREVVGDVGVERRRGHVQLGGQLRTGLVNELVQERPHRPEVRREAVQATHRHRLAEPVGHALARRGPGNSDSAKGAVTRPIPHTTATTATVLRIVKRRPRRRSGLTSDPPQVESTPPAPATASDEAQYPTLADAVASAKRPNSRNPPARARARSRTRRLRRASSRRSCRRRSRADVERFAGRR